MINIILKNKTLIKLYKYSLIVFKFMNKHLYILSILSLIARARKSIYYKIITWTIKLILALNLVISSGLFFSVIDLVTPFDVVYKFYNDLLTPYIVKLKAKLSEAFGIFNQIKKTYITENNSIDTTHLPSATQPLLELDIIENNEEIEQIEVKFNYKTMFFITTVGLLIYIIYFIPGGSTPPSNLLEYNSLNQSLIHFKVSVNKQFNILNWIFGDNDEDFILPDSPINKGKAIDNSIELTDLKNRCDKIRKLKSPTEVEYFDTEYSEYFVSPNSTPKASSSNLPLSYSRSSSNENVINNFSTFTNKCTKSVQTDNLLIDKSIETDITAIDMKSLINTNTRDTIWNRYLYSIHAVTPLKNKSFKLKSTQLLENLINNS